MISPQYSRLAGASVPTAAARVEVVAAMLKAGAGACHTHDDGFAGAERVFFESSFFSHDSSNRGVLTEWLLAKTYSNGRNVPVPASAHTFLSSLR